MIQRTQEITIRPKDEDFENRFRVYFYGLILALFCAFTLLLTLSLIWHEKNAFGAFVAMFLVAIGGGFAFAMCHLTYKHLQRQESLSSAAD